MFRNSQSRRRRARGTARSSCRSPPPNPRRLHAERRRAGASPMRWTAIGRAVLGRSERRRRAVVAALRRRQRLVPAARRHAASGRRRAQRAVRLGRSARPLETVADAGAAIAPGADAAAVASPSRTVDARLAAHGDPADALLEDGTELVRPILHDVLVEVALRRTLAAAAQRHVTARYARQRRRCRQDCRWSSWPTCCRRARATATARSCCREWCPTRRRRRPRR